MSRWSRIFTLCCSDGVPKRSFGVALIVGAILNLINQGEALLDGADLNLTKMILTFIVPYCVATYGAFLTVSVRSRCGVGHAAWSRPTDNHLKLPISALSKLLPAPPLATMARRLATDRTLQCLYHDHADD